MTKDNLDLYKLELAAIETRLKNIETILSDLKGVRDSFVLRGGDIIAAIERADKRKGRCTA